MEPWTTKYRPSHIADCVLPPDLRDRLEGIVKQGQSPHLLLAGPPGVGKTTVALALCNDLGWRVWFKNASLHGRIENVRDEIAGFAQPDLSAFFGQQNQNSTRPTTSAARRRRRCASSSTRRHPRSSPPPTAPRPR